MGASGTIVDIYWEDTPYGPAQECTVQVQHADGSTTFLVVPILRMTNPIPPTSKTPAKEADRG